MDSIIDKIREIAENFEINKVILFGSRARNDNKDRSDIDLAVYTENLEKYNDFLNALDEINTLLKFDVTLIKENMNKEFLDSIAKEGKIIYEKL